MDARGLLLRVSTYAILALVATLSLVAASARVRDTPARARSKAWQRERTPAKKGGAWVGSDACEACHPSEHASWHASYHRTMTQEVAPETVLGAFDGRSLDDGQFEHRVERRGDEFWVWTIEPAWLLRRAFEGPDAVEASPPASWQRVVMSTGSHSMQMYWVPAGEGNRLIAFPFAWSVEGQTWVPNESTLLRPHEPYVVYGWNDVCIKCHAVSGEPGFASPEAGKGEAGPRVQTRVAELGIACESCHGPGDAHIRRLQNPLERYMARFGLTGEHDGIVDPGEASPRAASEICAQCHSASLAADDGVWLRRGSAYQAGGDLESDIHLVRHPVRADQPWIDATLEGDPDYLAGRFWGDGMIRISGRDYNGTRESPCFVDDGFGCTTCHEMHGDTIVDQLKPEGAGDGACTECHPNQSTGVTGHTRHAEASEGSRCMNCHMPHTTYGLLKAIRSHEVSSPSVQESLDYGRPNACSICHLDRSLAWVSDELATGWGIEAPQPEHDEADLWELAAGVRWLVAGDAAQRALAAWYFGWGPAQAASGRAWMAPLLARAVDDDYAAVRWIATRSLRTLPGWELTPWSLATPVDDPQAARAAVRTLTEEASSAGSAAPSDAGWPMHDGAGGFDLAAYEALRARRDDRIVDLRE